MDSSIHRQHYAKILRYYYSPREKKQLDIGGKNQISNSPHAKNQGAPL